MPYTTWKADGATPIYWFIMAPFKSPHFGSCTIYFHHRGKKSIHHLHLSGQISAIPKPELRGFLGDSLTKPQCKVTNRRLNGRCTLPRPICCRVTIDPDRWTPGGCKASDEGQHLRRYICSEMTSVAEMGLYFKKYVKHAGNTKLN